ncbi:MAG: transporter family protein [Bacillales bacterium]|jgi:ATP-binding cassette subfamily B protein|nr:transporter family protein [Bacillales bacterium]
MSENNNVKKQPQRGSGGPGGGGPFGGSMKVEKPKDFKGTMRNLLKYLKPYRNSMIAVILIGIVSQVFAIVGPKVLGKATTKLFEGIVAKTTGTPNATIDFGYIGNIILILCFLYLLSSLFMYFNMYVMSGVSQKISYNLRKEISEKMNRLPLRYFDKRTHGEVLSRVTNDVDTISNSLNQSMSQIINSVIQIIGILIMMFSIHWMMTLVSLLVLPLSMVFITIIAKKSQGHFKNQQKFLGTLNGHVEEMYSGHIVMKAFNGEERSVEKFNEENNKLYLSSWKSQYLSGLMMPIMNFIGNIGYVGVAILGGYLAVQGKITVGDIQAFMQYMRQFTYPISQTAQIANVLQSTAAAAERVFEFLGEEEEVSETSNPIILEKVQGEVEFRNVKFGYNEDKIIINNFTARIKPGQKVAIVGPTGAGKTTIVKLLMRFYDINDGEIFVDGHEIREFTRQDLRSHFGMVLQDTWLFNGTIMENIRYGKPGATDDEVKQAAKAAYVDHFVRTLPDGYNMVLNEEASNVSQGQKQLLTIARAILANPSILILDEATSSVDTRTEVMIQEALARLMGDKTSFIIAHRLSTIRNADLILVMDKGDIIEQGTHKELLEANGFYTNLYNSQFDVEEE